MQDFLWSIPSVSEDTGTLDNQLWFWWLSQIWYNHLYHREWWCMAEVHVIQSHLLPFWLFFLSVWGLCWHTFNITLEITSICILWMMQVCGNYNHLFYGLTKGKSKIDCAHFSYRLEFEIHRFWICHKMAMTSLL